jgi:hypothetical protein
MLSRILCFFISLVLWPSLVPSFNWFCSYLSNRKSQAHVSCILFSSSEVPSSAPQEFVLGTLLFNVFDKDLCHAVVRSKYLLLVNDIKMCQAV